MPTPLEEINTARKDIESAIHYFRVIADTVPDRRNIDRHIAKLSAHLVKLGSLATLTEYGV